MFCFIMQQESDTSTVYLGQDCEGSYFELLPDHPLAQSHVVRKLKTTVIPKLSSQRMPDLRTLSGEAVIQDHRELHDKQTLYASSILVSLIPWRKKEDLFVSDTWWDSLQRHTLSSSAQRIADNIQTHHQAFVRHNDGTETEKEFEEDIDANTMFADLDTNDDAATEANNVDTADMAMNEVIIDNETTQLFSSSGASFLDKTISSSEALSEPFDVSEYEFKDDDIEQANDQLQDMKKMAQSGDLHIDECNEINEEETTSNSSPYISSEVISLVKLAITNSTRLVEAHSCNMENLGRHPTISNASSAWTLNDMQHKAFLLLASAFLDRLLLRVPDTLPEGQMNIVLEARTLLSAILKEQSFSRLLMFLSGSAGTGKSQVIKCLLDFATRWDARDIIAVTATSGIAAVLLRGQTWQSALAYSAYSRASSQSSRLTKKQVLLQDIFCTVGIMIIDEISLSRSEDLSHINIALQKLKGNTEPFGGIHMLFTGDLYQLSVGGSVFEESSKGNGHLLWRSLNAAIELQQNHRQSEDPHYANILSRFQTNEPTQEDINEINKHVMSPSNVPPPTTCVITPANVDRAACNRMAFTETVSNKPSHPNQPWKSTGSLCIVTSATHSSKRNLPGPVLDNATKQLLVRDEEKKAPYILNITLGTKLMNLSNELVLRGIANGTKGTLVDVVLRDNATVHYAEKYPGGDVRVPVGAHWVSANEVAALVLKYDTDSEWHDKIVFSSLGPGLFPVFTSPTSHTLGGLKVSTRQFPVTPLYAMTGHKAQGQSMKTVIVGIVRKLDINNGWLYVALSRVTTRKGLFLLKQLPTDMTIYKPRTKVMIEMERIRKTLVQPTIARINQFQTPALLLPANQFQTPALL